MKITKFPLKLLSVFLVSQVFCVPDDSSNSERKKCLVGKFVCDDKNLTICRDDRCNGYFDCDDESDEKNCTECADQAKFCKLNLEIKCIPDYEDCDNEEVKTDEDDIGKDCLTDEFQCKNNECINFKFMCDGRHDCVDESDEDPDLCNASSWKLIIVVALIVSSTVVTSLVVLVVCIMKRKKSSQYAQASYNVDDDDTVDLKNS